MTSVTPTMHFSIERLEVMYVSQKPTMTIHECCEAFRANLIRCSERKMGAMIVEGKFPFAVGTESGKQRTYIISSKGCYEYLDKLLGEEAIRV